MLVLILMSRRQFQRQPNVGIGVKSISSQEADPLLNLSKGYLHSHSLILKIYQANKPPYLALRYRPTKSAAPSNLFFVALPWLKSEFLSISDYFTLYPIVQSGRMQHHSGARYVGLLASRKLKINVREQFRRQLPLQQGFISSPPLLHNC